LSNIVLYKLDDSIATITMDDGKVNVMSLVMISELNKAMPNVAIEICRQRLAPAHFSRAVINAESYGPSQAVTAGFLDQIVPAADLLNAGKVRRPNSAS
jgi:hypothetical protein